MTKRVPLIILGAGKVGRALVRQLLAAAPRHAAREGLALPIVAWCDRAGASIDEHGLAPEALIEILDAKAAGRGIAQVHTGYAAADMTAIIDIAGADDCIVVDVTATTETIPALDLALQRGYAAATANKLPLAGPQAVFDRLTGAHRLRYESTVGSAVPVIETAQALMRAADRLIAVRGALSGTLGFLCTGLQAGRAFSGLVREAMRLGYTEPDPRADLGGMDVARKALILARTLDWKLEPAEVKVSPLVPEHMTGLPLDEFLARLHELDAGFRSQAEAAAAEGKTLRYVAELAGESAAVGLQAVPLDSPLGRLHGNDNLVAFHTHYYPEEPLVLQGRGAGVDAAAAGVHSDIVALAA